LVLEARRNRLAFEEFIIERTESYAKAQAFQGQIFQNRGVVLHS